MPADPGRPSRVHTAWHDSEFGRWCEAFCDPHPALADHVQAMWFAEGQIAYQRDRILPRGTSHLLINLGPAQHLVDPGGGPPRRFEGVWFSGQQDTFLETEAPEGVRMMGVSFFPHGAYSVIGFDQDELTGEVLELSSLMGDGISSLRQRLLDAVSPEARFSVLEEWLLRRAAGGRPIHPVTRWAVQRLSADSGRLRISELASEAGYTRKHLSSLFRRQVGLAPKTLARIFRFHRAVGRLRGGSEVGWAEVAFDCGYYDQSHLIRDLKAFAGLPAGQLMATPFSDDLTIVVE